MRQKVVIDSGNIYDNTLKGGRLGFFVFSQESVIWSRMSYNCSEELPLEASNELPQTTTTTTTTTTATTATTHSTAEHEEHEPEPGPERTKTETILVCSLILCTTIIICATSIVVVVKKWKRRVPKENENLEVKRKNLTLGQKLGEGNFGTVYKGSLRDSKQVKFFPMTRFQIVVPLLSHDVTKNLSGHRMHVVGPQIPQINP